MGFTKVFSELTTSSVWELPYPYRVVWTALMVNCGPDSIVPVSEDALWRLANVTKTEAAEALEVFLGNDKKSRSKAYGGKRVELVDGGIKLLNYAKYREKQSPEAKREYMRRYMRERREREKGSNSVNFGKEKQKKVNNAWRDERKLEAASASAIISTSAFPDPIKNALMLYAKMREGLATGGASARDSKRWTMDNAHSLIAQTQAQIAAGRPERAIVDRIQTATTGGFHAIRFDQFFS